MTIRIGFAGDTAPTSGVDLSSEPDDQLGDFLSSLDEFVVNLEAPITSCREVSTSHYSKMLDLPGGDRVFLRAPEEAIGWLQRFGVSVCNLANNHILDYGEEGIRDTHRFLDQAGIKTVGAGTTVHEAISPLTVETNGHRIRFVPGSFTAEATRWTAGAAPLLPNRLVRQVRDGKKEADSVIAILHVGIEFSHHPIDDVRALASCLLKAGASLVICHHPHVLQAMERTDRGVIAYSLGNFCFPLDEYGQGLRDELLDTTRLSTVLAVELSEDAVEEIHPYPIRLAPEGAPKTAEGSHAKRINRRLSGNGQVLDFEMPKSGNLMNAGRLSLEILKQLDFPQALLLGQRAAIKIQMTALKLIVSNSTRASRGRRN